MNATTRKLRGKRVTVEFREISRPTEERMKKLDRSDYEIGDDKQGRYVITVKDSPLDRMLSRDAIAGAEYAALMKYKHHFYHGGLEPSIGSVDLNRVFSPDPGSMSGMAKTERQAHHRQQYRDARALLGHRTGIVVDNVVCAEHSLEVAGFSIGWTNKPQAIAAATEMLRDAGYRLARLWGMA